MNIIEGTNNKKRKKEKKWINKNKTKPKSVQTNDENNRRKNSYTRSAVKYIFRSHDNTRVFALPTFNMFIKRSDTRKKGLCGDVTWRQIRSQTMRTREPEQVVWTCHQIKCNLHRNSDDEDERYCYFLFGHFCEMDNSCNEEGWLNIESEIVWSY